MVHIPSGSEVVHGAFNISFANVLTNAVDFAEEPSAYWTGLYRALAVLYCIYLIFALHDLRRVWTIVRNVNDECDDDPKKLAIGSGSPSPTSQSPSNSPSLGAGGTWSVFSVMCLLAYRLYTGFNTATWLPYLLAREGESLWFDDQAAFMGVAKLIYGAGSLRRLPGSP
eukprot:Skav206004  [mRNA]  locus=scaffold2084:498872:504071:- [translate_table: standard]